MSRFHAALLVWFVASVVHGMWLAASHLWCAGSVVKKQPTSEFEVHNPMLMGRVDQMNGTKSKACKQLGTASGKSLEAMTAIIGTIDQNKIFGIERRNNTVVLHSSVSAVDRSFLALNGMNMYYTLNSTSCWLIFYHSFFKSSVKVALVGSNSTIATTLIENVISTWEIGHSSIDRRAGHARAQVSAFKPGAAAARVVPVETVTWKSESYVAQPA